MEEGDILARGPSNGSLSAAAAAPELQRWSTLIVENKHRPFKFNAPPPPTPAKKKNKQKKLFPSGVSVEIKSGVCHG